MLWKELFEEVILHITPLFSLLHTLFKGQVYVFAGQVRIVSHSGLNEIYVWFLLPTYPIFFNPALNIKMVFREKIHKMGTFSDFVTFLC